MPGRSSSSRNCARVRHPALRRWARDAQGIVHVIGPELGLTQPGMTIVCGDSHTATHGAFGALAFGIGTSEVEMVLATQCSSSAEPRTYEVRVDGRLRPGVSAKDIILALIARIGIGGGTGHVFEYTRRGHPRAVDGGADDGLQHVDRGRRPGRPDRPGRHHVRVPQRPPARAAGRGLGRGGRALADAADRRRARRTTNVVTLDADDLEPMVTYGTNPGMGIADHRPRAGPRGRSPTPADRRAPRAGARATWASTPGQAIARPAGRRRLHRLVHQQPHQRPARRRPASCAAATSRDGLRVLVVPGLAAGEGAGRARGPRRGLPGRRRRVARGRLLDVHRHERRPARARPVRASAPATATSRAARARADARSSPRR